MMTFIDPMGAGAALREANKRIEELERENARLRAGFRVIDAARKRIGWKPYQLQDEQIKWHVELYMKDSEYDAFNSALNP